MPIEAYADENIWWLRFVLNYSIKKTGEIDEIMFSKYCELLKVGNKDTSIFM